MSISPERHRYHAMMPKFISQIAPGSTVYDIGKSLVHDYASMFRGRLLWTVDICLDKDPDMVLDVEIDADKAPKVNALLCNGVIEQCNDPMLMLKGCRTMLNDGGLALFGFCLLGYPPHDCDRFRFTRQGALMALERIGFSIIEIDVVQREGKDSYIYVMARKTA